MLSISRHLHYLRPSRKINKVFLFGKFYFPFSYLPQQTLIACGQAWLALNSMPQGGSLEVLSAPTANSMFAFLNEVSSVNISTKNHASHCNLTDFEYF